MVLVESFFPVVISFSYSLLSSGGISLLSSSGFVLEALVPFSFYKYRCGIGIGRL